MPRSLVSRAIGRSAVNVVITVLLLAACLSRFSVVGWQRTLLNSDSASGDQDAYLQLGLDLREHGILTDGTRNPLFPLLLAAFAEREWGYFTHAKLLSLMCGALAILAIFFVGYREFGLPIGLLSAFLLSINMEFIAHSSFVLVESLLTLCVIGAWYATVHALRHPNSTGWWALTGGMAGLTYLAKGSGLLIVACVVVTALLLQGLHFLRHRGLWAFFGVYVALAIPLWVYNWTTFGDPVFSYPTTHQMWLDRWTDSFVRSRADLPTVWTYLQTHSLQEIWSREVAGLSSIWLMLFKMLWPTRSLLIDEFLTSWQSGAALVILIGLAVAARTRVRRFVRFHRGAVLMTIATTISFGLLFGWYVAIVPIPIRFLLPLLPLLLLFVSSALIGIVRWLWTISKLSVLGRGALAAGGLCVVVLVGFWFLMTAMANARAVAQSPFEADATFNQHKEAPLRWIRTGHQPGEASVLTGAGSSLPMWRQSDWLRFVRLPTDVDRSEDFDAFVRSEDIQYIVMDTNLVQRSADLAQRRLGVREVAGDRVVLDDIPSGWALGYVHPDAPCQYCVLRSIAPKHISHAANFVLGDAIHLAGYDLAVSEPVLDGSVVVTLYWEVLQPVTDDYTVFVQLLGPDGLLHGQMDRQPLHGKWPTSRWRSGQWYADKFTVDVDEVAPTGDYVLLVGLYDLDTGARLPATRDGARIADDAIVLDRLIIR